MNVQALAFQRTDKGARFFPIQHNAVAFSNGMTMYGEATPSFSSDASTIEVLELPFDRAFAMISNGDIRDGKTIMLLQHAALHIFTKQPLTMNISGDYS